MKETLKNLAGKIYGKELADCNEKELYYILTVLVKEAAVHTERNWGDRKLYYISAEFLIGRLLANNLINLGIYNEVETILREEGVSMAAIEEYEPEPSLGNGGLGRLAACFLDSIATLGLPGDGIGLNYHFGLFRQEFRNRKQEEEINPWLESNGWLTKTKEHFEVPFGKYTLHASLYQIDVAGYENGMNKLNLFDVDTVDETIVQDGIQFDKKDIPKNLTLFLYPDDSDRDGQLLRIYQQYFMVCCGVQLILRELKEKGHSLQQLHEHAVIQINDTHPSMVIPELIRKLTEEGIAFEQAVSVVSKTCAYTNHTILAEALETWPLTYLEETVPHLVPIIKRLDAMAKEKYKDPKTFIIDEEMQVHMAHMDIHYGFSVNGVAALHTEILKESELKPFFDIYPEKFNNKTNGITFRRWLMHANPELSAWITGRIGDGFKKNADLLENLLAYRNSDTALEELLAIKQKKKSELAVYLKETQGIEINDNSVYDIQVKRLHEYKRQQMNALYVIYKYRQILAGKIPKRPVTVIFGAKAAPAYTIAKDIIHLILCLQEIINNDPAVSPHLKVVMIENYNVSLAEKLIPACDISEQISLASKEASGTGNMKFMLNGAVTLGTEDGANMEIHELVGDENIFTFGASSNEVIQLYKENGYHSGEIYDKDPEIEELVDFIISKQMIRVGDPLNLCRLYKELVGKDWFMTLLDVKEYIRIKEQTLEAYEDRTAWAEKMLINIAKSGYFSSDRTIAQYNEDIWHL